MTVDAAYLLGLAVSTVLPILVGLVTTRVTHPGRKAVLLAALSALTGLLTEWGEAAKNEAAYNVGAGALAALVYFGAAVAMHYGLWKPTGVSGKAQDTGRKAPTPTGV
jgi:hypothetical protein